VRTCPACGSRETDWVARVRGPDGKERGRYFRSRIDAERYLTGRESSKLRGEWLDPILGQITLEEWAGRWLETVRAALKPKTVLSYESLLASRVVPTLGAYPIASIVPSDVQAWVNEMISEGLSASRIRQAHVVLSQALTLAVRDARIGRNPAIGVKLPRLERREAGYFEPEVVERIAAAMPEPYDLFIRLLGTLGPRYGEAAALRRRSVNLLTRRLSIEESMAEVSGRVIFGPTKSHTTRKVPLTLRQAAALDRHLDEGVGPEPEALVFTSRKGGPLRHRNFHRRIWVPTLERLHLPPVGVHVLRHSAAAALIHSGAPPKAVQQILGHRSAAFTLTVYGHLFDADLDQVANGLERLYEDWLVTHDRAIRSLEH
jgi:integrase